MAISEIRTATEANVLNYTKNTQQTGTPPSKTAQKKTKFHCGKRTIENIIGAYVNFGHPIVKQRGSPMGISKNEKKEMRDRHLQAVILTEQKSSNHGCWLEWILEESKMLL